MTKCIPLDVYNQWTATYNKNGLRLLGALYSLAGDDGWTPYVTNKEIAEVMETSRLASITEGFANIANAIEVRMAGSKQRLSYRILQLSLHEQKAETITDSETITDTVNFDNPISKGTNSHELITESGNSSGDNGVFDTVVLPIERESRLPQPPLESDREDQTTPIESEYSDLSSQNALLPLTAIRDRIESGAWSLTDIEACYQVEKLRPCRPAGSRDRSNDAGVYYQRDSVINYLADLLNPSEKVQPEDIALARLVAMYSLGLPRDADFNPKGGKGPYAMRIVKVLVQESPRPTVETFEAACAWWDKEKVKRHGLHRPASPEAVANMYRMYIAHTGQGNGYVPLDMTDGEVRRKAYTTGKFADIVQS